MLESLAKKMRDIAEQITPDHFEQGAALTFFILTAVSLKSWGMIAACVGYFVMHFCYNGAGDFQTPLRYGKKPGIIDILIISWGICSLIVYFALAIWKLIFFFADILP